MDDGRSRWYQIAARLMSELVGHAGYRESLDCARPRNIQLEQRVNAEAPPTRSVAGNVIRGSLGN